MSLSLVVVLLVLFHTCLLTEGGNQAGSDYNDKGSQNIFDRIFRANEHAKENLMEGDILQPRTRTRTARNALCHSSSCLWEKDSSGLVQVPYELSNEFSWLDRIFICKAMRSIQGRTCIKFIPRTNHRDYISIVNGDGCYSYVSRIGGAQELSLNRSGCIHHGVIQHELIHALGFHHEQSRSDRDQYVRINWENIIPDKKEIFQKHNTNNLNTSYDYSSIMHYGRDSFSVNGQDTITPIPDASVQIGRRSDMSLLDVYKLNKLYSCSIKKHAWSASWVSVVSFLNLWCS